MKNALLSMAAVLMFVFAASAQSTTTPGSGPEISFEKDVHDFGNMKQNGDATYEFKFTNTGTEPLVISNAKGSCGCTVPSWPREPILPGKTAVVSVKYDSKRVGPINKSVTITSNATNAAQKVIRIKGNIEAVPAAPTTPVKTQPAAAPISN